MGNNDKIANTAKLYRNTRIIECTISDFCSVGDDSDLLDTNMSFKSEVGRRNLIRNSSFGVGSYTGTNCVIKNTTIGNFCSIGWNVSIGGGNHNHRNVSMYTDYWYKRTFGVEFSDNRVNESAKPVFIGNDVWVGSGATILSGIQIGDGAVVGAGAVVTKNVPPYAIVVGVPAKIIKYRFSEETIKALLTLKWWFWDFNKIIKNIDMLRNEPNLELIKKLIDEQQ